MDYYRHHVFFCTNQREPDASGVARPCCAAKNASSLRDYAKKKVKALGLSGAGQVRVNNAGCLDRCEEGPCVVVYPEGVWYAAVTPALLERIVVEHLRDGRVVEEAVFHRLTPAPG